MNPAQIGLSPLEDRDLSRVDHSNRDFRYRARRTELAKVKDLLKSIPGFPGRLQIILPAGEPSTSPCRFGVVDYAHTPALLKRHRRLCGKSGRIDSCEGFHRWQRYCLRVVTTSKDSQNGQILLQFRVENWSGWESATRLRKAKKPGGLHRAIIPDKGRGEGLNLGGKLQEVWIWTESYSGY